MISFRACEVPDFRFSQTKPKNRGRSHYLACNRCRTLTAKLNRHATRTAKAWFQELILSNIWDLLRVVWMLVTETDPKRNSKVRCFRTFSHKWLTENNKLDDLRFQNAKTSGNVLLKPKYWCFSVRIVRIPDNMHSRSLNVRQILRKPNGRSRKTSWWTYALTQMHAKVCLC